MQNFSLQNFADRWKQRYSNPASKQSNGKVRKNGRDSKQTLKKVRKRKEITENLIHNHITHASINGYLKARHSHSQSLKYRIFSNTQYSLWI